MWRARRYGTWMLTGADPVGGGSSATVGAMKSSPRARVWSARAKRVVGSVLFRLLVTCALLAIVASGINWSALSHRIEQGKPIWFAVAVALVALALVIGALRWWVLLGVADIRLTGRQVGRIYAVSTFAGTFLPTSVGADVARALLVVRRGRMLARVTLTILLDRAAAFAGLVIVAVGAYLIDPSAVPATEARTLAVVAVLSTLLAVVGLVFVAWAPETLIRRLPTRWHEEVRESRGITLACVRRPKIAFLVLISSIAFQVLIVLQTCALARSISVDLSFAAAAVTFTLVTLALLIPLSVAGFGIREGSYIVLLGTVGITATDATLISLMTVAVLFIASLPGAALLVRSGMTPVFSTP